LLDFLRSHDAIPSISSVISSTAGRCDRAGTAAIAQRLRAENAAQGGKGAKVIYVPGNHDEFLRNYYGTHFGGIDVVENTIHVGVDGVAIS